MNRMVAPVSPADRRRGPLLRLFSSIWFGIVLLTLMLVYASLMSALPQVRGAVEMTEMQAFRHWVWVLLMVLFTITLVTATLTRIRWNVVNLGVLTVHTGLLMLIGGAAWYFFTKVEGDTILLSPRLEVIGPSGTALRSGEFLAEAGQTWQNFMPALGGQVRFDVLKTEAEGLNPAARVTVRAQVGPGAPQELQLDADENATVAVSDKVKLRLTTFEPVDEFYDDEVPALYYRPVSSGEDYAVAEIHGLPLYRERFLDEDYPLEDRLGREVQSKRTVPRAVLAGFSIPTGWFEHWRLPIELETPDAPFDVEVTGYLPYITGMRDTFAEGAGRENPALELGLRAGADSVRQWLLAKDPARSFFDPVVPFEFIWVQSTEEIDRHLTPLAGPHELVVEVLDPPVKQTVAIQKGQTIAVEGTPYQLTIKDLLPSWPLMTPGFEKAASPTALVDVTNGEKSYNRTVIQRFPHLSQDIDESGTRHKDGPYDANLILHYRTAAKGYVKIIAGPGISPVAGVFSQDGSVERIPLAVGQPQHVDVAGLHLDVTAHELLERARTLQEPVIEPLESRRPNIGRQVSTIRLKLTGKGEQAGWRESRWVIFSMYPHVDSRPITVDGPDGQRWELMYSRQARDLGAKLGAGKLHVDFFPGRRSVEAWRSEFLYQSARMDAPRRGVVQTNDTLSVGRWTLFQSGAAQDHWSYTILGVGNRKGIWTMAIGCCLITLGCLYAFYVKPVLRRRIQQRALNEAAARSGTMSHKPPVKPRELAEVGS